MMQSKNKCLAYVFDCPKSQVVIYYFDMLYQFQYTVVYWAGVSNFAILLTGEFWELDIPGVGDFPILLPGKIAVGVIHLGFELRSLKSTLALSSKPSFSY